MTIAPATPENIARAVALLQAGACVALPTETVYGLAADATNGAAIARIYATKQRPEFNPLIVHVPTLAAAQEIALFTPHALALAQAYWPGPLTLVLKQRPAQSIAPLATAGLATIALRIPNHPVMQTVLRGLGKPLAAPSANASGLLSPTAAAHVRLSLGEKVPLILDGGACAIGLESSIIACVGEGARLLRHGVILSEDIYARTGVRVAPLGHVSTGAPIEAPGALLAHYAPRKPLRLNATQSQADTYLIGFGDIACDDNLSRTGDLLEAAANLFAALHRADAAPQARISIAPLPEAGLGQALNDRLRRAAHNNLQH